MRFSDKTASIPESLIALQEKGEIVFLCGAGISMRYDLPSFWRLTELVYQELGETWTGHAAEEEAMGFGPDGKEKGPAALDRALFALAKRLRGDDSASRIRAERAITEAVEKHLKAPATTFSAHADVWALSRDAEMRGRVVTTNFDTLFEHATTSDMPSRAGPDLPPPLGSDFWGVLHLHGRIADGDRDLSRTGLVLNSAEFGEAYLRAGWAARYVYDLARASTIVILGYGADDPPMRYILEVLSADRERYPDIREIFAFVSCKPDTAERARTSAIWSAKGATAILYDSTSSQDHDVLYDTIAEWATFAADPTAWRRREAGRILEQDPEAVNEGDWERLTWMLSGGDAGALIAEINPAPRWAGSFAKLGLFVGDRIPPLGWIQKRLGHPEMPGAVIEHIPISIQTLAGLEFHLSWLQTQTPVLAPIFLQAWRLIVQVANDKRNALADRQMRWHRAMQAVDAQDHSLRIKRDIVACLRPRMLLRRPFRWPGLAEPKSTELRLRDLISVEWGPDQPDRLDVLVAKWPADSRPDLLRSLLRALDEALEEAADIGNLQVASSDVRSISRHGQDEHPDGFYGIVRASVDLWEAEIAVRPDAARTQARAWLASDDLLLRRMGLHALAKPIFASNEVTDALLGLSDEQFWVSDCRRETMQLFVLRWGDLDEADRLRVETRIAAGLPRDLLVADAPDEHISTIRDNAVFIRLARIAGADHALTPVGQAALDAVSARHPEWKSDGEQDDFRYWTSGIRTIGREGDISLLQGVPPERVLSRVEEVVRSNPHGQGELWRLYCDAEPHAALAALVAGDPTSDNRPGAWQSFFWSITTTDDPSDIHRLAFDAINAPEHHLRAAHAIIDWILRRRSFIGAHTDALLALWDRLLAELSRTNQPIEDQSRSDVTFAMLNSAEGKIGTVLLELYRDVRDEPALRTLVLERIAQLISAPDQLGFLGAAGIIDGLPALFQDDPDWTRKELIPLTNWTSPFASATWSVLLRGQIPQLGLYAALKPNLLVAGAHAELDRALDGVASWLLLPLLWRQDPKAPVPDIEPIEVRRALAQAVETVRSSAAYWLSGAIEQLPGDPAEVWRTRVGPLFRQAWPLEPTARSPGATLHLVRLLMKTGDAFAEAVNLVIPAIGYLDAWDVEIWLGPDGDAKPFYRSDPTSVLRLLLAVVDPESVPAALASMLEALVANSPELAADLGYRKLLGWARRRAAP
jgi:hypothetical protein